MKLFTLRSGLLFTYAAAVLLFSSFQSFSQQAWTRVPSPDPSTSRNILSGISGTSSTDVWGVGHYESNTDGAIRNYIMHWNGAGWQLFPGTDLGFNYNDLWDVTSITANDVWAAGTYNEPGTSRSQLLHWNGSTWSHTSLPNIPGGSFLFSIDAISANDIWAVGGQAGSPTDPAYAIHYNGSGWTEFPVPNIGSYSNRFEAIDGIASNDVWAVGRKSNSYGDFHAMVQHWNGSNWANFLLPISVDTAIGVMESVTMIASNDVWALGSTVTGVLIMIHWDGTSWTEVSTAGSAGGAIIARGTDIFGVGDRISQWNGSNWAVIEPLAQLSYPSLVSAIAFPNGDIWTAGRTSDTSFNSLVYRTANATPVFVYGNFQILNTVPNSPALNIDEKLRVQDADISQTVIYTLLNPPSHGTVSGLPDTAITAGGFTIPSGVTYMPTPGYSGTDEFVVKVSVGPLTSQATIDVNIFGALPVLMSSYSVSKTGSTAIMKWSTTSEINASEFVMERSQDGINFSAINRMAALGSGYNYSLVDPSPLPGWNYYRLRLTDKDGSSMFFAVKSLNFDRKDLQLFTIYPNPVEGRLLNIRLNAEGDCNIFLYDEAGKMIMNRILGGMSSSYLISLPENLAPGIYIVKMVNGNEVATEKILIR